MKSDPSNSIVTSFGPFALFIASSVILTSLGRDPPESNTRECRPKYLIVKVEISVASDTLLQI
ncbi:unnamed protein product [Leptidea sinapis]|uniref:Uncharacterized protein n=1 Tax=Leptidea sinapis TaxID=189913 RepID=A0A5E4QDV1_9NEOP|nr:unnamed protein product [Leptidea sinapis]